jgi:hypothetical protein
LAMDQPLSGTLAPPWVFVRTFPLLLLAFVGRLRPETPTYLSLVAPDVGFTHRRSPRARSPFTRPCRSFCCAYAELIRDQTPPDDFCNCFTTCEQPNLDSRSSQGRWPRPPSFSSVSRRSLLSSDTWRATLRPFLPAPVLVPPGYPGLPSRDAFKSAPPPPSFTPFGA